MVRIVPDAAERDVRLRAARAAASAHRPGAGAVRTAVARRATGRLVLRAGAVTARVANVAVVTARVAIDAVAIDAVATDRVVIVGV